jgi:hypothetical protein
MAAGLTDHRFHDGGVVGLFSTTRRVTQVAREEAAMAIGDRVRSMTTVQCGATPYGLVGDILIHDLKLHHLVGQKPQTPAGLALGWLRAGERHEARLLLAVELAVVLSVGWASV